MKYNSFDGCPTSQLLYPYDFTKPTWPIVLVEGPLDAIKYWLHGIPALALLGCQNWSDFKLKLILSRCPSTVWLSFDNDADKEMKGGVNAGQKAQREIYSQLKRYVDTQTISLPPGNDPFDLVPELLQEIYNAVWTRHAEKTTPQQVANV
jgi:DNA primase